MSVVIEVHKCKSWFDTDNFPGFTCLAVYTELDKWDMKLLVTTETINIQVYK